ncbi:MAG: hypothetical protein AVDCRST_MAG31-2281 [uncultured Sphingomonas sp.]|uniref:DUF465 domain-containing protein n=1 Tax=uncultured Sphingomonas sp. TaxID=158754 RepID=A0A6J4TQH5_9SPHN|nr:DUF465 domain-containing protein [uncultured Sphingomonas sp.]CAA9529910.1 MAG: hypothetical protein AVDCRST_MAG31-2281 [uncultured Sphingomonas sp.]
MNDDEPSGQLTALRAEHRRLDALIEQLRADPDADQLEIARLKKRKLRLRDEIAVVADRCIPDIIA